MGSYYVNMQHYFGTIVNDKALINGDQLHHLIDVRRAEIGEKIEISEEGESYLCEVTSLSPLEIKVIKKIEQKRELDIDLTVAFSLLKGDKNELIVLKGTELGASTFIPFVSKRTIIEVGDKAEKKRARLIKIAQEGANQCRRDAVPNVTEIIHYTELLSKPFDVKLFAYEGDAGQGNSLIKEAMKLKPRQSVLIVIGPEGGFTDEEAAMASDYGFQFVSLGRRILRAETAALYACSILGAYGEE